MAKQLPPLNGHNHLIATLSPDDRALLEPHATAISLDQGMVLEERDRPIERIIFPISGVTSIIALSPVNKRRIEAGLFGHEGMSGTAILLGAKAPPDDLIVQVPGHGLQISADHLQELLKQSFSLQQHFLQFIQAMISQTSQTALSNKHNNMEERLARWLLMCHDRVAGDRVNLTHEFMSIMLGVRRAGVTISTQILEGKGLIRARRGEITILNREGLEEEANGSYGRPEADYLKLFGGLTHA